MPKPLDEYLFGNLVRDAPPKWIPESMDQSASLNVGHKFPYSL